MSDAKRKVRISSLMASLLRPLVERLERYMGRVGMIAYVVDPAGGGAGGDTILGGDAPAGGDAGAGAGDQPAGDKPAGEAAAGTEGAKPDGAPVDGKDKPAGESDAKPDAKNDKEGDKPTGAPEAYEAFTMPEGIKLDEPIMGEFQTLAKDLNLPQEAAQKLVDLAGKMQLGTVEQIQATVERQSQEWAEATKADKEFGGDSFEANLALAKSALDKFGSPELKTLLSETKLGNHPEVVRFMVRAGKAISQDGFIPGGMNGASRDPASVMYPSMKH